jgi:hypothetical protein
MNIDDRTISTTLEKAARAVIGFLRSFGLTMIYLPLRPAVFRAWLEAPDEKGSRIIVPPIASLVTTCFLFGLAIHYLLERSGGGSNQDFLEALSQGVSAEISITTVLLRTVPVVIATLLVGYILVAVLLRERQRRLARASLLSYAASYPLFATFVMFVVWTGLELALATQAGPRSHRGPTAGEAVVYQSVFIGSILLLGMASVATTINVTRIVVTSAKPEWGMSRKIAVGLFVGLVMQAMIIPNFTIVSARDMLFGLRRQPMIPMNLRVLDNSITTPGNGAGEVWIRVYCENASRQSITIIEDKGGHQASIRLSWHEVSSITEHSSSLQQVSLQFVDSASGKAPYLDIPAGEKSWMEVKGTISGPLYASLVEASRAPAAKDKIQFEISFLRGYSTGAPGEWYWAAFDPVFK